MVYITVKQSPKYHQLTLEEFLFGTQKEIVEYNYNENTRTYVVDKLPERMRDFNKTLELINKLSEFNNKTAELRNAERHSLFRTFHIPKKSGGLRKIDAPNDELMKALRELKMIFEVDFNALYHTSAFAYIKKRSTIDSIRRHQKNESKWFGKFDLSNFFGSTTMEFVMKQFAMIYPFSEVCKTETGRRELEKALSLAFLDGGLPQGTPISPLITNIMMIPVDHRLANDFRDFEKQNFVYTRYADDFLVSSKYDFKIKEVENKIVEVLKSFDAPFTINSSKTRYGSNAGRNWNLGIMLNKDNVMTVGNANKRRFEAMLCSFIMDTKNGNPWDIGDIQVMDGLRNYYSMVEGDVIDRIIKHTEDKFNVNLRQMIRDQLNGG